MATTKKSSGLPKISKKSAYIGSEIAAALGMHRGFIIIQPTEDFQAGDVVIIEILTAGIYTATLAQADGSLRWQSIQNPRRFTYILPGFDERHPNTVKIIGRVVDVQPSPKSRAPSTRRRVKKHG